MAAPVSIGDAIAVSNLAYKLARALTTGRKGVPNAIKETKHQLMAIGNALSFCCFQERGNGDNDDQCLNDLCDGDKQVGEMVANCRALLEKFELLIKKYEAPAEESESNTKRFIEKAANQLRWIKFLLDDNEFQAIKNDLALHVESITLALCARVDSNLRGSSHLSAQVDGIHDMVKDLHGWFVANLRSSAPAAAAAAASTATSQVQINQGSPTSFTFRLQSPETMLCSKASFKPDWIQLGLEGSKGRGIFECHCELRIASARVEHEAKLKFSLLHISAIVRVAGPIPAWKIVCASSSSVVPILISGVNPTKLSLFQHEIDKLAIALSRTALDMGSTSSVLYKSRDPNGQQYISVLDMKGDTVHFGERIIKARFDARSMSITHSIESFRLLHYRTFSEKGDATAAEAGYGLMAHSDYAALLLKPSPDGASAKVQQISICVDRATELHCDQVDDAIAVFPRVSIQAKSEDGTNHSINDARVVLFFDSGEWSNNFVSCVRHVQRDLKISCLKFPQLGEKIVFRRPCGDLLINAKDFFLANSHVSVLYNSFSMSYRLVVLSESHETCMSIDLPASFFESLVNSRGGEFALELKASFIRHHIDGIELFEDVLTPLSTLLHTGVMLDHLT